MRKNKMICSLTSVFLAVLMIVLGALSPIGAVGNMEITEDTTVKPVVNSADKIDPALKEIMAEASPDEKIPVAIWYEDIDQEQVDMLTTQKVGFSEEEIAVDYEMPSTELLNSLKDGEYDADAQMQMYMERTEKQRENERKRTDEYIMTRREFSREKYSDKSAKLIKEMSISDDDITFNSQYAPMVIAEISVSNIMRLAENEEIESLLSVPKGSWELDSLDSAKESIDVDMINLGTSLNLSGANVKVGLIDSNVVYVSESGVENKFIVPQNQNPEIRYSKFNTKITDYGNVVIVGDDVGVATGSHADNVANILLSVAPNITLYSLEVSKNDEVIDIIYVEVLLHEGVQMLSMSMGCNEEETSVNYAYSLIDKWFDHIIAMHDVTVVKSAGNTGENEKDDVIIENGETEKIYGPRITSPGLGYNVITVGAYNDETNEFCNYTSYKNSIVLDDGTELIGCEKPDVILPSTFNGEGTSYSTPFLSGIIALIYELKPALASHPEAIKAIVLASCHDKSDQTTGIQENIEDGITERQGAGIPNAWIMAGIVSQGTYGTGRFTGNRTQAIRRFYIPKYGVQNMNVSITWIKENNYDSDNTQHLPVPYVSNAPYVNLDLSVYSDGIEVGCSNLAQSSTEMAYFDLNSSAVYEIRINKTTTSYTDIVRYGYAYSTDVSYISCEDGEEGIYYVRNYASDKYLTLNDNGEAVMENFTGGTNQQWVISGTPDDYEILPAYEEVGTKINFGAQVGSNPYYKAVSGTSDLNLNITSWETDTSLEPDAHIFTSSGANGNNILSYTSSTGIFVRSTSEPTVNMYRMWVLEDINFRVGDVDLSGNIDIKDESHIQKCLSGLSGFEFNNLSYYLSDFDGNGVVNVKDATDIRKFVSDIT